jgi:hypothetical protein
MPDAWSLEEVAATVADYFVMLDREIRGESYNKKEHNRLLQKLLNDRSAGAIEFKHANISAVLREEGYPFIDGYKPRSNYQEMLREVVLDRLSSDRRFVATVERFADAPVPSIPTLRPLSEVLVAPPTRDPSDARVYERNPAARTPIRGVNYLEREARNASLGAAGERFVLEVEDRRLREAGKGKLAGKIEHVSISKGDGLGYDIMSFETDGRERYIEVKTTSFGSRTPFFASKGEVAVSEELAEKYQLYRVFRFRESPKLFMLGGSLRQSCALDPIQYRASLR